MKSRLLCLPIAALFLVGCGKEETGINIVGSGSSALSSSTLEINKEAESFKNLAPSDAKFLPSALVSGTWWDDATVAQLCDEREDNCADTVSGRTYVRIELDPQAVRTSNGSSINIFGRLKGGLAIICALGEAIPKASFTGNYVNDGDHTITFTTASAAKVVSVCGIDAEAGLIVRLKVSQNSDTSLYEKSVNICFGSGGSCTAPFQKFMYKVTSTEINIATLETHDDPGFYSRLLVNLNKTSKKLKVEYLSAFVGAGAPPSVNENVEVRRLYKSNGVGLAMYSRRLSDANWDTALGIYGNLDQTNSAVQLAFEQNSQDIAGTFVRSTGAFTSGAATNANFGSPATLQTALYGAGGGYNSTNYYDVALTMSETLATNFDSFAEVFTKALPQ